jgi:HD-GYP domain-containing protein (c-di-GMP phosphodiesterase class II)
MNNVFTCITIDVTYERSLNVSVNQLILKIIAMWNRHKRAFIALTLSIIVIMLGCSWSIVYFTGGTKFVYTHLMYIPIIIAGFFFRGKGGMVTGIAAGVLLGPLMPLDVLNNVSQTMSSVLYRMFSFVLIGVLVGSMSKFLGIYLMSLQDTLDEISHVYANTLKTCANMVSVRDEETAFHCERVAYNAFIIGQSIGLDQMESEALYWTGLLHDVGKIGVNESILLKPDKLTVEEFELVKRHTVIGFDIINSLSNNLQVISEGVRSHHEKWDGSGYPDGLKGSSIPIFGRILAVVDVFEALTSERPYKDAWEPEVALEYLVKYSGTHFDPNIVSHFQRLFSKNKLWISDSKPLGINEGIRPSKFNKGLWDLGKI